MGRVWYNDSPDSARQIHTFFQHLALRHTFRCSDLCLSYIKSVPVDDSHWKLILNWEFFPINVRLWIGLAKPSLQFQFFCRKWKLLSSCWRLAGSIIMMMVDVSRRLWRLYLHVCSYPFTVMIRHPCLSIHPMLNQWWHLLVGPKSLYLKGGRLRIYTCWQRLLKSVFINKRRRWWKRVLWTCLGRVAVLFSSPFPNLSLSRQGQMVKWP